MGQRDTQSFNKYRKQKQQESHYIDRWSAVFRPKEPKTGVKAQILLEMFVILNIFTYLCTQ